MQKFTNIIDYMWTSVTQPTLLKNYTISIVLDSDDAVGPHFPKHVLGSRTDPAVNSLGIYGNTTKQRAISPSRPLDPIQEANSIVSKTLRL